jgi:hypothetical protein
VDALESLGNHCPHSQKVRTSKNCIKLHNLYFAAQSLELPEPYS